MDAILSMVEWPCALMYLDDIAIFLHSPRNLISHVKQSFVSHLRCCSYHNLKEMSVSIGTIDYLSHVTCPQRLEVATHTLGSIKILQPRTNIGKLRSLFRLCSVFRVLCQALHGLRHQSGNSWKKPNQNILMSWQPGSRSQCTNYQNILCYHWFLHLTTLWGGTQWILMSAKYS